MLNTNVIFKKPYPGLAGQSDSFNNEHRQLLSRKENTYITSATRTTVAPVAVPQ